MDSEKEKRTLKRISLSDINGSIELQDTIRPIVIVNASEEGVCIEGADFPVGSIVRLAIDHPGDKSEISLYCKVVWSSAEGDPSRKSGLIFLNTNKVLFKQHLVSFNRLLASVRKQLIQ